MSASSASDQPVELFAHVSRAVALWITATAVTVVALVGVLVGVLVVRWPTGRRG